MHPTVTQLPRRANGDVAPIVATPAMNLSDAVYHTAHQYDGGIPALAPRMPWSRNPRGELTPMSPSTLQHKVNPNCHTHHTSVEEARDMMVLSNDYRILYALASITGHVCIRIDPNIGARPLEQVAEMAREFGELVSAYTEAKTASSERGTSVSDNERSRVQREGAELMAAINAFLAGVAQEA